MNGFGIINQALAIIGEEKPNTLFMGRDGYEYLYFFEGDEPTEEQEEELKKINVKWSGKFECYGIDRELLWDLAQ